MNRSRAPLSSWPFAMVVVLALGAPGPGLAVEFNREVIPILSNNCFACHGPDANQRKADLRLDQAEQALQPGESGKRALIPGSPDQSELYRRITTTDPDDHMPPPESGKHLSPAQIDLIRAWIEEGAQYKEHWAFVAPAPAALPEVKAADWPRQPIDYFILARLEAAGLKPAPHADPYTLIRRLYFDLVGLPPSPEEADAFAADPSSAAYLALVDQLLASPAYGERWARPWLDIARYSDTNGYEKDRPRSIWAYRDWVIDALNADLPFDRFTVEQIAGDMLPDPTLSQRIATGFHRNTMLNEEGGIDPLEYRFHSMTDRVLTTSETWLGLTVGCAQCHTHKYDPITQREYYQLMAFLNNADEPTLDLPSDAVQAERARLEARIARQTDALADQFPDVNAQQAYQAWQEKELTRRVQWQVLEPNQVTAEVPLLTVLEDDSILASGDMTKRDVYEVRLRSALPQITALRLEALPDERLPQHGPGRVYYEGPIGDFFLSEFTCTANNEPISFNQARHSFSGGGGAEAAIDGDPLTGWTINGGQGQAHAAVFNLSHPLQAGQLTVQLLFERYYAAGLGRFRLLATDAPGGATASPLPPELERVLRTASEARTETQERELFHHFLLTNPELKSAREKIDKLRQQLPELPTTLVMAERPPDNPRPTWFHKRGEFLQPTEEVEPSVPEVLPPLPQGQPTNRLGFARWLVATNNPLVARVTVNRHWAAFFGEGIVRTPRDFGFQGEPPTHPELLDWLAVEFMRQGWSLKQLHWLIVTSATYQQSSHTSPEMRDQDPENRLLGRAPHVRLSAELIRDALLSYSGLLSQKVGGPSVFPPQPPSVTTEGTYRQLEWKVSPGEDRYRRGLYTFSKRTAPYAMFATFDAPSGEACVIKRELSNTALQALSLMNDQVVMDAAQALGRRMTATDGPLTDRLTLLFRSVLTRLPTHEEIAQLADFFVAQHRRFASDEHDAELVGGPGAGEPAERATWTALARVLFNLDEAITKS